MRKIILFSVLSNPLFYLNTQTLQTYNGVFENGKAIYQYYDNEKSDRIYEGTFNYTGKIYSVLGQFKSNKREGLWKISALNKAFSNESGKISLNTLITGSYLAGNMTGLWNFSNSVKIYNPKTKKPSPKAEKITASATFKDNHFVNEFKFEKSYLTKVNINGQFNESGFADGTWSVTSPKIIEEIKYKNGFKFSHLIKDITTGDKILFYDSSLFQEQFWKAYDQNKKIADLNGKIYFLDTVQVQNPAIDIWKSDLYSVEKFSTIINPLYYYKKGHVSPNAYEIKIIPCDYNADCYANYMKRKAEETEKFIKEQNLAAEKLRLENLEKEKLAEIEKEKENKRIQLENIKNTINSADKLVKEKRYKEAISIYQNANQLQHSDSIDRKILESQKEIQQIDSLHSVKKNLLDQIKTNTEKAFSNTNSIEVSLTNKKKSYAKSYLLCIDYLKKEYNSKFQSYVQINENRVENLDFWTENDQNSLNLLKEIEVQLKQINNFQQNVLEAVATNHKNKLRVLNSSLNPQTVIQEMINFKQRK